MHKKNNRPPLEKRSYQFEVMAGEGESGNTITGRPIVYESRTDMGYFDEIIERGALDGADLRDVRFLVNHDTNRIPLARSRGNNGNSTMQLTVDDRGMEIKVLLDTENNAEARALYSAVKRGDISGMSFMFGIASEEWVNLESEHPTRRIEQISAVVEVSAVTFPAYETTEIDARDKGASEEALSALERAKTSRIRSVETDQELELLKLKTMILGGH